MSSDDDEGPVWPTKVPMLSIPTIGDSDDDTTDDDAEVDVSQILFSGLSYPRNEASTSRGSTPATTPQGAPALRIEDHAAMSNEESAARRISSPLQDASEAGAEALDDAAADAGDDDDEGEEDADGGFGSGWLVGAASRLADLSATRIPRSLEIDAGGEAHGREGDDEEHIARRFHTIISEEAPLEVAAPGRGLTLDESWAGQGLAINDLDDLIARLQAGAVDLSSRSRPSDLPHSSTLFSDDEDTPPKPVVVQSKLAKPAMARQPAQVPAHMAPAAVPVPRPAPLPQAPPAAPQGPLPLQPGMMMPAKFAKFAMPVAAPPSSAASTSTAPPAEPASQAVSDDATAGPPLRPTVKMDLRQSIAQVAASLESTAQTGAATSKHATTVGNDDDSDDDDDDWMTQRKALKSGSTTAAPSTSTTTSTSITTSTSTSKSVAAGASVSASATTTSSTAKPATTSTSTDTGTSMDDLPGISKRTFFVSTADLPGTDDVKLEITEEMLRTLPRVPHPAAVNMVGVPKPIVVAPKKQVASHSGGHDAMDQGTASAAATVSSSGSAPEPEAAAANGLRPPEADASHDTEDDLGPAAFVHRNLTAELGPGKPGPGAVTIHKKGWMSVPAGARINLAEGGVPQPPKTPATTTTTTSAASPSTTTFTSTSPTTTSSTPTTTSATAPSTTSSSSPPSSSSTNTAVLNTSPTAYEESQATAPTTTSSTTPTATSTSSAAAVPQTSPTAYAASQATSPTATTTTTAAVPKVSPTAYTIQVSLPSPTATKAAPTHVVMPRLPAWVQASGCITVAIASPDGLSTHKVTALCRWLLGSGSTAKDSSTGGPDKGAGPTGGAFGATVTIVSLMVAHLPHNSAQLAAIPTLSGTAVPASAATGAALAVDKGVQALLVACVPGCLDVEHYHTHRLNKAATTIAATAVKSVLNATSWGALLQPAGTPTQVSLAGSSGDRLSTWASVIEGADAFVNADTSFYTHHTSLTSPSSSPAARGHATSPLVVARPSAEGSAQHLVCSISQGSLVHPHLLPTTLQRASSMGLSLAGMTTVYLSEEACAYVAVHSPHRPRPFLPMLALAFAGRGPDPFGRWRAQLGSSDIAVAQKFEPDSLHALFGQPDERPPGAVTSACSSSSAATNATRGLFSCSFDFKGGNRELSLFFGHTSPAANAASHAHPSASPHFHAATSTAPKTSPGPHSPAAPTAPVLQQLWTPSVEVHWTALPGGTAAELAASFRLLQHLSWCGFILRGLLRYTLPETLLQPLVERGPPVGARPPHTGPVLVVELAKEEAGQQLMEAVRAFRAKEHSQAGMTGSAMLSLPAQQFGASSAPLLLGWTPEESERLRSAARASMLSLPGTAAAQDLIGEAEAASHTTTTARATHRSEVANHDAVHLRGVDELVGVLVQPVNHGRALQDALLLTLALMLGLPPASVRPAADADTSKCKPRCEAQCELVACRFLKQVPAEVVRNLSHVSAHTLDATHHQTLNPRHSSGTDATSSACHVVPGHPAILLMLHGPDIGSQVSAAAKAVQQLYIPRAGSLEDDNNNDDDDATSATSALLSFLRSGIAQLGAPTAAVHRPAMLIGCTQTLNEARAVLASCFQPNQVLLDPSFHDGVRRAKLSPSLTAASGAEAAAHATALHVMTTPHPLSGVLTVSADDLAAPNLRPAGPARNAPSVLPRLLKLLQKEGFEVLAATMTLLEPEQAKALDTPFLSGHAAVVVWFNRSNAVQHIRQLVASSSLPKSASCVIVASASGAATVISMLWPHAAAAGQAKSMASRDVIPMPLPTSGAGMMQVTCMAVLPASQPTSSITPRGKPVASLDFGIVANALDAVRSDGFSVVGIKAARLSTAHAGEMTKVARLSAEQKLALVTSAASSSAAANIVVLALSRENAVLHLQMKMQEAAMPRGSSYSSVSQHVCVAAAASNVQQQLLLYNKM